MSLNFKEKSRTSKEFARETLENSSMNGSRHFDRGAPDGHKLAYLSPLRQEGIASICARRQAAPGRALTVVGLLCAPHAEPTGELCLPLKADCLPERSRRAQGPSPNSPASRVRNAACSCRRSTAGTAAGQVHRERWRHGRPPCRRSPSCSAAAARRSMLAQHPACVLYLNRPPTQRVV